MDCKYKLFIDINKNSERLIFIKNPKLIIFYKIMYLRRILVN